MVQLVEQSRDTVGCGVSPHAGVKPLCPVLRKPSKDCNAIILGMAIAMQERQEKLQDRQEKKISESFKVTGDRS